MKATRHDPAHEARFDEWLDAGECDALPETLAACPVCRTRFEELRRAEERVQGAALEQREDLRVAAAMPSAPGDERIERFLDSRTLASKKRSAHRLGWWLAAAATLLVVFLASRPTRLRDGASGIELGGDELELVEPIGAVERFERFRWRSHLPTGTRFRVHVEGVETPSSGEPTLAEQDAGEELEWTPEPAILSRWPTRIRWWVTAEGAFAGPDAPPLAESRPAEASSRSP